MLACRKIVFFTLKHNLVQPQKIVPQRSVVDSNVISIMYKTSNHVENTQLLLTLTLEKYYDSIYSTLYI